MMSISQVPPGFRFHPTEEELLQYYLKKRVGSEKIDLDVIQDVDLNKLEPWDIQDKCKIGSSENDLYFFSHKDKKYPTGTRTNRATRSGFWKATGRDKVIYGNSSSSSRSRIGMRKTLVFYKGRAPHGQKSDWIMHEYRLDGIMGSSEEGWVICRVFKKKNQINHSSTSKSSSTSTSCCWSSMSNEAAAGTLEEMLQLYSMKSRNDDHAEENNNRRFLKLPSLQYYDISESEGYCNNNINGIQDWASLDHESRLMLMSRGTTFLDEQHADHHSHISSNSTTSTPAAYNQPHLWTSPI